MLVSCGAGQEDAADRAPARLQQALSEVAELKQALVMSQQQAQSARQQIEALVEHDSRLRQKLMRLEQKVEQARHFAYHDELTGLPNRRLLLDRLSQAMAQAARQRKQVALLLLDLDGFKSVNDRLGHGAGDQLLQQVADRLTVCIRGADTACRYGGDEFVIMLLEIEGHESAAAVAQKIRAGLAVTFVIGGSTIAMTASIGTAIYPVDGQNFRDLIKQADITMYRAKGSAALRQARLGARP